MRSTKIIILLAIFAISINARGIKRQKKITRVLPKSTKRGCQLSVVELPGAKALLEAAYGCLGTCDGSCGSPSSCGYQNIFLEELPCGCNCIDGYGITNAELSSDRIPVIRLPKTLSSIDPGIAIPAINLPTLYQQCDIPSCQCQNALPYQILDSPCSCKIPIYELFNPIDVPCPLIKMPVESIQSVYIDSPRSVMNLPNCGCQMPSVSGCQRQKCGYQLSALDIPCNCQLPTLGSPCGSQYAMLEVPCGCQLPPFNLPCGYQLPGLDCGCQIQAFNSPCSCQVALGSPCGCQLPVPNVPYAFQLPSLDVPCAYQLPALDVPCGCQLPNCGCELPTCGCQLPTCGCQSLPPPVVGCGKYLRQCTLQPPFL